MVDQKILSAKLLILCCVITSTVGTTLRTFNQEIPISVVTTRGCNGSLGSNEFQTLVLHNGLIYVGATNTILQLSSSLTLLSRFQSGPGNDSTDCGGPPTCDDAGDICLNSLECADNYNRILLPYRDRLLACGTLHAVCDMLELEDISRPYGSITNLQCKSELIRQSVSIGSRALDEQLVGAIRVNEDDPDQDLLYLGQPEHFIRVLYAPSSRSSYFTQVDDFVENEYNMVANYHLAWTTENYGYVLWTNQTSDETKLSRYCNSIMWESERSSYIEEQDSPADSGDRTYTEIPIECQSGARPLTHIVAAKFIGNEIFILYQDGNGSAICSANMTYLNQKFDFARERCWEADNGYSKYVFPSANCSSQWPSGPEWNTCGLPAFAYNFINANGLSGSVAGRMPVELTHLMSYNFAANERATSFTVGFDNGLHFVFIGTTSGDILKVRLDGNTSYTVTERLSSGGNLSILDSMVMDADNENLYTISKTSIFRVEVANCGQYETCVACIESRDPNCGWCVQESRCTRKSACSNSDMVRRWIGPTLNSDRCPSVSVVEPNIIPISSEETTINVTFTGTALQDGLQYSCEFSSGQNSMDLPGSTLQDFSSDNGTGNCFFPATSSGLIPTDNDHNNITLRIVYNQRTLASGSFRVYQCSKIKELNQYTMCSSCVSSEWGCSWCAGSGMCNNSPTCTNQLVIDQPSCPVVTGYNLNMSAFIPVGQEITFFLGTQFLPGPTNEYMCQYNFCGKSNSSTAFINPSSAVAECTATAQLLTCDIRSSPLQVFLRRDDYIIDTSSIDTSTGKLYNCSAASIRDSCTRCMGFRRECDQCVWCPRMDQCVDQPSCTSDSVTDIRGCEAPVIESISPARGPFQGGTVVTISGQNLGSTISDIDRVKVGSIDCEVITQLYYSSRRIVCRTKQALSSADSGRVTVFTTYGRKAKSEEIFQYRNVLARGFARISLLNQSVIAIMGRQLNVGNNASLHFQHDDSLFSLCTERQDNSMICQLPPVESAGNYSITIKLDGYTSNFPNNKIDIVDYPMISIQGEKIVGFRKAGGTASFHISSLVGVNDVKIQIGEGLQQKCAVDEKLSLAQCHVRPLTSQSSRTRRQTQQDNNQEADLILNGVYRVPLAPVTYVEDPSLSPLHVLPCHSPTSETTDNTTNEPVVGPTKTIQIPGTNFDSTNSLNSDYTVTLFSSKVENRIDPIPCNVTFIESSSLFCRASSSDLVAFTNQRITINVTILELNLIVTNVQYCTEDQTAIIAVAITVPIVISLLLIILFLLYRQKKRVQKRDRERSLILKKLDDLENKTREKARNAYYELQVGYMNKLSENITHRITFRPPELYFIQTLFNLPRDHPVLDNAALRQESALKDWMRLVKNKDFLMTFIRTLDDQKKFTVQEKANVASLLVVCLFSDMPYFTNIMFDLLAELIQKHIQKNPKLLLRRSESVVEKMVSHWLSITLYNECIMGNTGEPVFLLTKAIHYLVNSAPCDVIAHKSVNSLNESTLLSTEIHYSTKLILASIQETNGNVCKPVEISVIDVDSITQVKQKIIDEVYKDRPFSECPKPEDLDLEMLCNGDLGEGVVLSDIDGTSEKKQNFTKINTLKHYNVNDKSRVVLRPVGTLRTASLDSKTPLLNGNGHENGNKIYHLIDEESQSKNFMEVITNRPFQEIFLTRMVRSKSTLQEYVDGVFNSILNPEPIPVAVRYFFQFLDREAARHRINDAEVVHIWKTNSLLLRYWVNVLKNPEFIFDINKTPVVDSCLSVITQAFMDACSTTTRRKLNHDSPSNKLLYAKDAEHYQKMVNDFFTRISNTPWIGDEEIDLALKRTSQQYAYKFNPRVACQQLYQYLFKYKEQVINAIRIDENEDLAQTVERVALKMEGKNNQTTMC